MALDKANIFKLENTELVKYKNDPFLDCFESTKNFAKALKNDIDTKETPHSLLLSADYGMGKTFFSTRFTQYLRNNNYDVIYFSVWENDYMQEPFLAFAKVILNYIHNKFKAEKYKANAAKLFDITEKLAEAITFSTGIGFNISAEKLISAFKTDTDPIVEFRKQLTAFINKIPKKKLIIIVDELDRCRPDYAMKTLECIKHFFEIEGLFVILPTNKEALNDCIKSLYGIENKDRKCRESYFQKFFNDERVLKKPIDSDYLYVVNQYLTNEKLAEALSEGLLIQDSNKYNNIEFLRNWFARYSFSACLTIRELKDYSLELLRICNNFYEPIRVQWLACIMAYKNVNKDLYFKYPLPREHCFYKEIFTSKSHENGKDSIVSLATFFNKIRQLKRVEYHPYNSHHQCLESAPFYRFFNSYNHIEDTQQNYKGINDYFSNFKKDMVTVKSYYHDCNEVLNILKAIEDAIKEQKNIIDKYQQQYGSDDNDDYRETTYQNIINNPEILYSITVS